MTENPKQYFHKPELRWWTIADGAGVYKGIRTSKDGYRADVVITDAGKWHPFICFPELNSTGEPVYSRYIEFDDFISALVWAEQQMDRYLFLSAEEMDED